MQAHQAQVLLLQLAPSPAPAPAPAPQMDLRQQAAALATVEQRLGEAEGRVMEQERGASAALLEMADLKTELRSGEMARQDLQVGSRVGGGGAARGQQGQQLLFLVYSAP